MVESLLRLLNQFKSVRWLNDIPIPGLVDRLTVLQFADDTILFLNNIEDLSSRIQSFLMIFLVLTCLKINLSKSTIIGVGDDLAIATQIALNLCCRVDSFSFLYLGIPLGGRMLDWNGWDPMVDMFKNRLSH